MSGVEGGSPSPGDIGGIVAGVIALGASAGAGVKWLLGWKERRDDSRSAKLQEWHNELDEREKRLDEKFEQRVSALEREARAYRMAFYLVSPALRQLDPHNEALARADEMLKAAFPLDPLLPPEMGAALARID